MSTTFEDIRAAIAALVETNWTTTDVVYDNRSYIPDPNTSYVRLVISEGPSRQVSCGGTTNCHRIIGLINVSIFVPLGTGTRTIRQYADTIADFLRNKQFSSPYLVCRSPRIVRVGEVDGMYQMSVIVDFWCDVSVANAS